MGKLSSADRRRQAGQADDRAGRTRPSRSRRLRRGARPRGRPGRCAREARRADACEVHGRRSGVCAISRQSQPELTRQKYTERCAAVAAARQR